MVLIQEKANLEKHKFTPIAGKRGPVDAALLVNADQKYAFTLAMEIQEVLPHKTHNARLLNYQSHYISLYIQSPSQSEGFSRIVYCGNT